ncbi:hypothetical protein H6G69_31195 [Nostoc sp. FACHB-110]|nr:hypothetical protein [Nostoc sp. FACHB-110]
MSEGFIAQGHTVIGCARSVAAIAEMKNSFGAPNDFTNIDVADEQQVKNWATEIHGSIKIKNIRNINKDLPK